MYSELVGHRLSAAEIARRNPAALVLSGGPASVYADGAPKVDPGVFELGVPTLGICYGMQLMARDLGGAVERTGRRVQKEGARGDRAELSTTFRPSRPWMSHRDSVTAPPTGAEVTASRPRRRSRRSRTARGGCTASSSTPRSCTPRTARRSSRTSCTRSRRPPTWTPAAVIEEQVERIRATVGAERVLCALSGGVDSAVAALLVHKAVGDQLRASSSTTGSCARTRPTGRRDLLRPLPRPLVHVRAKRFLARLAGVSDPEEKRTIVGEAFIRVFEEEAASWGRPLPRPGNALLGRDRVRRRRGRGRGQDQVAPQRRRAPGGHAHGARGAAAPALQGRGAARRRGARAARANGPAAAVPGPGLAIRIVGEVAEERLASCAARTRSCSRRSAGRASTALWQSFAVLPRSTQSHPGTTDVRVPVVSARSPPRTR